MSRAACMHCRIAGILVWLMRDSKRQTFVRRSRSMGKASMMQRGHRTQAETDCRRPAEPGFAPTFDTWPNAGVYQLWIQVSRPVHVSVGALGMLRFDPGTYVYTGRASRGLRARVRRHLSDTKRLHWHVDYLLARREVYISRVVLVSRDPEDECRLNAKLGKRGDAVARFGASDCQHGCPGHLWRVRVE